MINRARAFRNTQNSRPRCLARHDFTILMPILLIEHA